MDDYGNECKDVVSRLRLELIAANARAERAEAAQETYYGLATVANQERDAAIARAERAEAALAAVQP